MSSPTVSTEQPPGAGGDDLAALTTRRDALRTRRDALAHARRVEQAEAEALPVVMAAVTEARRNRDTSDSRRRREQRGVFEQIMRDVEALQRMITRVSRRVQDSDMDPADPLHRRAEQAQYQAMLAMQRFAVDLRGALAPEEITDGSR